MKTEGAETTDSSNAGKTIWVFTPSRTDPKYLEAILVQRHTLLQDAVDRVRESALTDHKHHQLFVGPRGCGKTHLVTLIVSRVGANAELGDRLRIAWLNEDETCTTFLDLLFKIHSALTKRYPAEFSDDAIGAAYEKEPAAAQEFVSRRLLETLGARTLLLVVENLDAIFEGLAGAGQKQLRAFIQENPKFAIVGSAQRLVEDLSDRTSPFFGFFQTEHLKPLNVTEATELLQNIARLHEKRDVVEFLATSRGRARVRALHHLSGGNHRIYIVLSQFITRESFDALLGPFMKMVDELTPYYQERIRWLPPLQRKIVEYLCGCEGTEPVKEIAKRLFATPQTISSQLQDLREKGYVEANQRGRESLYEITEPLMRICVEVKENQGHQPLRLLVDFLRVWYDDQDLKQRLGSLAPASESCAYLAAAIHRNSAEGDLRKQLILAGFQMFQAENLDPSLREGLLREWSKKPEAVLLAMKNLEDGNKAEAIDCHDEAISLESAVSVQAEFFISRALVYLSRGEREKAADDYATVIRLPGVPVEQVAQAYYNRGVLRDQMGDRNRAIEDYTEVIRLTGSPIGLVAYALLNRGVIVGRDGNTQQAVEDYTAVIGLSNAPVEQVAKAYFNRGLACGREGRLHRAIENYAAVISLDGAPVEQAASALVNRGVAYGQEGEIEHAIEDYSAVIRFSGAPIGLVAQALINRGGTLHHAGRRKLAIDDYTAVIELVGAPVEHVANARVSRGIAYALAGETERAIEDYTRAIELVGPPITAVAQALYNRAVIHSQKEDTQRAIEDYTAVIELVGAPMELVARSLVNRGVARGNSGNLRTAIEDYTAVISLAGAPPESVVGALVNRGVAYCDTGETNCAIEDYTLAIGLAGAPVDQVALALFNRGVAHGRANQTDRAVEDYTAVVELTGAPSRLVAQALVNRGVTHGEMGNGKRAIEDYTAVIGHSASGADNVARALINRGYLFHQQGEVLRAIEDYTATTLLADASVKFIAQALFNRGVVRDRAGEKQDAVKDYTAVIGLTAPPVEYVAKALINRGAIRGEAGERSRAIDDYSTAIGLAGAPKEYVAAALVTRGVAYGEAGDMQRADEDWEAVIGFVGAPTKQVALALYNRGAMHLRRGRKYDAQTDFETIIHLPSTPVSDVVRSHLALAMVHLSDGRWNDGFLALETGLKRGGAAEPPDLGNAAGLIGVVFSAGLSPDGRGEKVGELLGIYEKHLALSVLGEGVVQHLGRVFRAGAPFPSTDNLDGWALAWEQAAKDKPEFQLSLRLLRTGVNFLKSGGKDRGILLDLASTERAILEQTFELIGKEPADSR